MSNYLKFIPISFNSIFEKIEFPLRSINKIE